MLAHVSRPLFDVTISAEALQHDGTALARLGCVREAALALAALALEGQHPLEPLLLAEAAVALRGQVPLEPVLLAEAAVALRGCS